ncbi:MAG TPA: efflux RND transporter periplasmic adaptor subunit [Gemmataceae bacterium]|nr:efflux RND transporter periplasmic adaptor subunit [Gemmataceae bacterium]
MKVASVLALVVAMVALSLPACGRMHAGEKEEANQEGREIVVTSPAIKDVVITQPYVCQIHSRQHIEVRALDEGYLEEIAVREGQAVKKGDEMFRVVPILYKAKYEAEKAEVNYAEVKLRNTKELAKQHIVSEQQVALDQAELAKAQAKMRLAEAELNFTVVRAPFDGIVDRQHQQLGSLVKKDEVLTTLSDNSVMWVYFNVPEARYLNYKEREGPSTDPSKLKLVGSRIELRLANGSMFKYSAGDTVTVEGNFNNQTGNIAFRADFPNPEGLLRHGQTGTVLIHQLVKGAMVIPQRATFEILDKRYVWVIGEDHVVRQRLITVEHELDDIFVIKSGLSVEDKIILEGIRQVRDGDRVEYEFRKPEEALAHQKYHAE